MKISEFDRWVGSNNVPKRYEYGKRWWDHVELVRRFSYKFGFEDVRVVGHYMVETSPPEERLPMPAVALVGPRVSLALRWDFGAMRRWPFEWTVSIRRRSPYRGPTFGLFDPSLDLLAEKPEGLAPDWIFGPYRENPAEFSCEVEDEWDVATLLRLVTSET
jgi:hypothetical protein